MTKTHEKLNSSEYLAQITDEELLERIEDAEQFILEDHEYLQGYRIFAEDCSDEVGTILAGQEEDQYTITIFNTANALERRPTVVFTIQAASYGDALKVVFGDDKEFVSWSRELVEFIY
jgi:hypothetical protein